ncbi:hypothetical protein [Thalassococcus sp. S3]|uniref:hypothetical protein n=1 Tax=Thalassococcus sp. S3 TaxID=2017482 RepID=UPI001024313C|nr:hypothetical protein [Thalassococcus sp. S3]QBF32279.1 hypothetical protein CFI11_13760 [Thalassococcus sp. S3]
MALITPDERVSRTEDLLHSVQGSLRSLRKELEGLIEQAQAGEVTDYAEGKRQVSLAEGLVRTCQKVEASLVELENRQLGIAQGGYALDLNVARFEIGCRLGRLRACCAAGELPE